MELGLRDRVAFVTGAERGIGRGIALALGAEGAKVAMLDVRPESGAGAALEEMRARAYEAIMLPADVSDEQQVAGAVRQATESLGPIDVLVCNAGVIGREATTRATAAGWQRILGVNLLGAVWCCREVARQMVSRRRGAIILIGSTIQYHPGYGEGAYRASKIALRSYAQTMAAELAPFGIRVNCVSPGYVQSEMGRFDLLFRDERKKRRVLDAVPLGRVGDPEEVAAAVVFLASDRAAYITGADLIVDGGYTLRPLPWVGDGEPREMNE